MKNHTFLARVLNRPGVLNKVAMIVRRKMFNIHSLTVSPTRNKGVSAMTTVFRSDSSDQAGQVLKQLGKIVEVISIEEMDEHNSVREELMLVKLLPKSSVALQQLFKEHFYRVVHKSNAFIVVEVCGTKDELDRILKKLPADELLEIARTGVTALKLN